MNLVVLCKSWNHKKVLEILAALREQELRVRGLVALAAAPEKKTWTDLARKTHEKSVAYLLRHFRKNGAVDSTGTNGFIAVNGVTPEFHLPMPNGQLPARQNQPAGLTIAEYAELQQIPIAVVKDLNSAECVAALQRLETDILLLGGVPIIRANVLAVPKICTLNVHMALLPTFRGMNVAEWSIYCGAPAAVTVHQVDPGVDTGAILYRERIDVSDCPTIATMRAKVSRQQHLVLAKCTRLLIEKKLVPEPQQKEAGKQYYLMHDKLKKIVAHRLARGYHHHAP
ncbi:MAG: Methionyl-tRNA formyltransferase [bacterium]|nr:Methionyl-tRNA formyltransferase [bacterium]